MNATEIALHKAIDCINQIDLTSPYFKTYKDLATDFLYSPEYKDYLKTKEPTKKKMPPPPGM
jgi:hypothetical protein